MTFSTPGTTDRREAAVAAALAGAVVVILGYASGLGARTTDEVVAMQQPPAATPEAPPAEPVAPVAPVTPLPATLPAATASHPAHGGSHGAHHTPTDHEHPPTTSTPTPTPDPEPGPEPTDEECPPGLVAGVPVVGPGAARTTAGVITVVGGIPLLTDLLGDPLSCLVGELVGPTCCPSTGTRTRTETSR